MSYLIYSRADSLCGLDVKACTAASLKYKDILYSKL